ncbi:MAG: hypothetical protein GY941_20140 [Planctomycetes bacterium]|nr:hypothetical protein [Planctomycetota bacterium]
MERQIISAAMYSRTDYEELTKYHIKDSLSDQAVILWGLIDSYYQADSNASSVSVELLSQTIDRLYPKHAETFVGIIKSLEPTSSTNLLKEIIEQKKVAVKHKLTQAFSSDKDERVEPLLEEYERLLAGEVQVDAETEVLIAPDMEDIMKARSRENRITLLPPALNEALDGGPLRGHHVAIFSLTDMGKTLFVLNAIRGFIEDGYRVLYVGNEDPISDLLERFLVCMTGKDKYTVRKRYKKAQEYADKHGWDRLVWAELCPGTLGEIRSLIEAHKPDILVVDQIRNLDTGEKNHVRSLEIAAQGMRNFAKKYSILSVSVTQAADSANGKAILNRGDMDNSNIGIPSTLDLMIGMGATQEQEFDGIRTLSFPKNKVSGNKTPINIRLNTTNMRVE